MPFSKRQGSHRTNEIGCALDLTFLGLAILFSAGLSNLLLMGLQLGVILNTQRTWGRAALPAPARERW